MAYEGLLKQTRRPVDQQKGRSRTFCAPHNNPLDRCARSPYIRVVLHCSKNGSVNIADGLGSLDGHRPPQEIRTMKVKPKMIEAPLAQEAATAATSADKGFETTMSGLKDGMSQA